MTTYTINFLNNSSSSGSFCLFQQQPDSSNFSLAWLVKSAIPNSNVPISWNTDLYFFWAKTDELTPGKIFNAGQAIRTSLTENNEITLTKQDGSYKFIDQKDYNERYILAVNTDSAIVYNQASVGIGMSGSAAIAIQAQPDAVLQFALRPKYLVMFGEVKQGQVLDQSETTDAVQVVFPDGIFSMNVTRNLDNTWTITRGED